MTPEGEARLALDEGCELVGYADPLSPLAQQLQLPLSKRDAGWAAYSGAPWTCGYGHTGPDVNAQTVWSQGQADAALVADIAKTEDVLISRLPWFADLDPVRADVLVNIAFNVGVSALMSWPTTLSHFQAGDWQAAHDDLLSEGRWNAQVGQRANRLAQATLTGSWS